ncbi:MAG: Chemotaxis regulator - transmits chemoreceptor signals to flagellar motor components CheY, partial [uncultured Craurococcus sp.]
GQEHQRPDRRRLQDDAAHHPQPAEAAGIRQCRGSLGRAGGAGQAARRAVRPGHQRLEHAADDRARPAEGGAGRCAAEGYALHHDHRREQDGECRGGEGCRRFQLHREALQRRDAARQDREGAGPCL